MIAIARTMNGPTVYSVEREILIHMINLGGNIRPIVW